MRGDERTQLLWGIMPIFNAGGSAKPEPGSIAGAGYVPGIDRLGIPALRETDGSLGVSYLLGLRGDYSTAMPSGPAMASSFNPQLVREIGSVMGQEARAKGFNVLLAGGVNLMRDPRAGRTFEYFSEDPYLSGVLGGASVQGIQSHHVISTLKHFAFNAQETGRKYVNSVIGDGPGRESDLLAFQIAIERGQPGAIMCAYNRVGGKQACASDYLMNTVLKEDWDYKGFVMSDWGAVWSLDSALAGLDQQSGAPLDPEIYFDAPLRNAAHSDPAYSKRLKDMNVRVLTSMLAVGLGNEAPKPGGAIDFEAHAAVTREAAAQGIVLLRNTGVLPLSASVKSIAVIGGFADSGVLSGGGSSETHGMGGPAISVPRTAADRFAKQLTHQYQASAPLAAIRKRASKAEVTYRDGRYIADAVAQAKKADIAIVFATQWTTEGFDVPSLSLPTGQDALIEAVAKANPNTIVVLETGGPVFLPWKDDVAGVLEAWYPGGKGGEAIADVLFGQVNPSGHLPITFPASVEDLPRRIIPGSDFLTPSFFGTEPTPGATLDADYSIEGSDVGYRWNARKGITAAYPFGYGLSYTQFRLDHFTVGEDSASFTITNTGTREGADVAQIYLLSHDGRPMQRLLGFARCDLAVGKSCKQKVTIDPRLLARWRDGQWTIAPGDYLLGLALDAETIVQRQTVHIEGRSWN